MNSKTRKPGKCYKCGWDYPASYGANVCKFCGGPVYRNVGPEPGYCKDCGAYVNNVHTYQDHRCSKCHNSMYKDSIKSKPDYYERRSAAVKRLKAKYAARADKVYADWLAQLKQVNTHTLTEEEWLQACRHFGSCAFCGSESIDARMYFIRHTEGGKYNACNIVPACEQCANDFKRNPNPFRTMDNCLNDSAGRYRGQNRARLKAIVDYLQARIEEASDESSGEN